MSEADPAALRAQSICEVCNRLECVTKGWFRGSEQHNLEWIKHWRLGYELARARAEEAEKERDEALAALHDWYCVGCKQRYCAPPDEGTSRSSCPKCGKWMLFFAEHEREKQAMLLGEARTAWRMLLRVSLAPEDVSGVHMYEEARATLDRIDAFLAGPAAPPLPSAEQQETLSGAPAACPGLDRLNAETGEEYGQLVVDSSSAPPMSLEWFRDEYVRRSSVMEAWHRYFDELCDVLFPESVGRPCLLGWQECITRARQRERLWAALQRFTDHVEQSIRSIEPPSIAELRRAQFALDTGTAARSAAPPPPDSPPADPLEKK